MALEIQPDGWKAEAGRHMHHLPCINKTKSDELLIAFAFRLID